MVCRGAVARTSLDPCSNTQHSRLRLFEKEGFWSLFLASCSPSSPGGTGRLERAASAWLVPSVRRSCIARSPREMMTWPEEARLLASRTDDAAPGLLRLASHWGSDGPWMDLLLVWEKLELLESCQWVLWSG